MGARGYIKGGLELTPMGPFNIKRGGVSTPDQGMGQAGTGRVEYAEFRKQN